MKKTLLTIASCALLISCGETKNSSREEGRDSAAVILDYEETSEAAPQTFETSAWDLGEYVDDYGDKTGEKYIYTMAEGNFSNSATTNSGLTVQVLAKKGKVQLYFYEYNSSLAKDDEAMDLKIKDENGEEYKFGLWVGSNGCGYISSYRQGNKDDKFLELLMNNKSLKCSSKMGEYTVSTYRFVIDCTGFKKMYEDTFGE